MSDGADSTEHARHLDPNSLAAGRAEVKLASTLASADTVDAMAMTFAALAGFDEETACHLAMVAREAAVNAVIHGNRYDPAKQVTATFETGEASLRITIADEGEGIDVATIPDPLAPENLLRASGRGIFLMKSFMDEVTFRRLSSGTEVTLIKRRTGLQNHPMDR